MPYQNGMPKTKSAKLKIIFLILLKNNFQKLSEIHKNVN